MKPPITPKTAAANAQYRYALYKEQIDALSALGSETEQATGAYVDHQADYQKYDPEVAAALRDNVIRLGGQVAIQQARVKAYAALDRQEVTANLDSYVLAAEAGALWDDGVRVQPMANPADGQPQ